MFLVNLMAVNMLFIKMSSPFPVSSVGKNDKPFLHLVVGYGVITCLYPSAFLKVYFCGFDDTTLNL